MGSVVYSTFGSVEFLYFGSQSNIDGYHVIGSIPFFYFHLALQFLKNIKKLNTFLEKTLLHLGRVGYQTPNIFKIL